MNSVAEKGRLRYGVRVKTYTPLRELEDDLDRMFGVDWGVKDLSTIEKDGHIVGKQMTVMLSTKQAMDRFAAWWRGRTTRRRR